MVNEFLLDRQLFLLNKDTNIYNNIKGVIVEALDNFPSHYVRGELIRSSNEDRPNERITISRIFIGFEDEDEAILFKLKYGDLIKDKTVTYQFTTKKFDPPKARHYVFDPIIGKYKSIEE